MFTIAVHGGAGTIPRDQMDCSKQAAYEGALRDALQAGIDILKAGGSSCDAVVASVTVLEDCPLFNAGKGSVFNHEGKHEMDASLMRGDTIDAGAVSGLSQVRNPVQLAKLVMEKSEHVLLQGEGAQQFAKEMGQPFEPDAYFFDAFRYQQYQEALAAGRIQLDHTPAGDRKFSTVGAVALDSSGTLSAATSTGGMTNKKFGRVGDTPIIGAGTYANNQTCAVSCTGHGELFIRQVVAHQIHCLMLYKNLTLHEACRQVVMDDLVRIGGEGGLVAVDALGNIAMPFNSEGMYRASAHSNGQVYVGIYR